MGDVDTLTVAEYRSLPGRSRLGYRLIRNPLVMLGIGPLWALLLEPRSSPAGPASAFWARFSPLTWRWWRHRLALLLSAGRPCCSCSSQRDARRRGRDLAVLCPAPVRGRLLGARTTPGTTRTRPCAGVRYLKLPKAAPVLLRQHRPHHVHHMNAADSELQPPARARRESGVPQRADAVAVRRHPLVTAEALRRATWPDGGLRGGPGLKARPYKWSNLGGESGTTPGADGELSRVASGGWTRRPESLAGSLTQPATAVHQALAAAGATATGGSLGSPTRLALTPTRTYPDRP